MKKLFLIMILVLGLAGLAQANLITNGDFATNLNGWTTNGDVDWVTGTARLGGDVTQGTATLSQSFDIPDGYTQLLVSFDFEFTGTDNASYHDVLSSFVNFYIWGIPIASEDILSRSSYQDLGNSFVNFSTLLDIPSVIGIPADSSKFIFSLNESAPWWGTDRTNTTAYIDNVNIDAPGASVPEPAIMLLLGSGLLGLGFFGRKRFKK